MKRNSSTRSCFEPSILELVCGTAGKPQTLTEASFVTVLIQIWPTLLLIQTSTNVPGKAQHGTNTWVPPLIWKIQMEFLAPSFRNGKVTTYTKAKFCYTNSIL